jgi:hypothetical protein
MQEILDGVEIDPTGLQRHLAECADCRSEWDRLQQVHGMVAQAVNREAPPERLERATSAAMDKIQQQPVRPTAHGLRLSWACVAALVVASLLIGVCTGRALWPREVIVPKTVTRVVKVPEVHEKIVKVDVPVVQERVVVRRVPVYKTRTVYRDREAPEAAPIAERPQEPVKCEEILVYLPSRPIAATARVTEEVQPAEVLETGESGDSLPTQGRWQSPGATGDMMVIAQNLSD